MNPSLPRNVVFVEDERVPREDLVEAFREENEHLPPAEAWALTTFATGAAAVRSALDDPALWESVSVVILDHKLEKGLELPDYEPPPETMGSWGLGGLHLGHWLKRRYRDLFFVFRSAELNEVQKTFIRENIGHLETFVKGTHKTSQVVDAAAALWSRWAGARKPGIPARVGGHPIDYIAPSPLPVLVTGDSGTGKSSFARDLHSISERDVGAFFSWTCWREASPRAYGDLFGRVAPGPNSDLGALVRALGLSPTPDTALANSFQEMLLASTFEGGPPELVPWDGGDASGHVLDVRAPGGAPARGTLLVEHVERLPPVVQSAIIELLDTGVFAPEGSVGPRFHVDVRLVAASSLARRQLRHAIDTELVERLAGWVVHLPSLRERVEDALRLAGIWSRRFEAPNVQEGLTFSDDGRRRLQQLIVEERWFDEPVGDDEEREGGNLRGLRRLMDRAFAIAARSAKAPRELRPEHLDEARVRSFGAVQVVTPAAPPVATGGGIEELLRVAVKTTPDLMKALAAGEDGGAFVDQDVTLVLRLADHIRREGHDHGLGLDTWADRPGRIVELPWDTQSTRRWRWTLLLAALLVASKLDYNASRLTTAHFQRGKTSNVTAPVRSAYERFLGGKQPDLEFNKSQQSLSILRVLHAELSGEEADEGATVSLVSKLPNADRYWAYVHAVYRRARALSRDD